MPSAGFEPKIPTTEWPQTHALHRAATEISLITHCCFKSSWVFGVQARSNCLQALFKGRKFESQTQKHPHLRFYVIKWWIRGFVGLLRGYINVGRQVVDVTIFLMVGPRISMWFLDFGKFVHLGPSVLTFTRIERFKWFDQAFPIFMYHQE